MSEEIVPVSIEILEKEYTIACPASERDGLVESAKMLSDRLRQVRDGGKVLSTERMVIITVLNLIHEFNERQREAARQQQVAGRDASRHRSGYPPSAREAGKRDRRPWVADPGTAVLDSIVPPAALDRWIR